MWFPFFLQLIPFVHWKAVARCILLMFQHFQTIFYSEIFVAFWDMRTPVGWDFSFGCTKKGLVDARRVALLFTIHSERSDISRKEISTGCFWHMHRNLQDILESRHSNFQTMWQLQPNWQWPLVTGRAVTNKYCRKRWTVPELVPRSCLINCCSYTWESLICSLGWFFTRNSKRWENLTM